MAHYVKIALGVVERWVSALVFERWVKADKKRFFCVRWAWENKKTFFYWLCVGKTSADGGGRTTGALACVGWVGANTSAKRSYFFYLIGCSLSIAVFSAFNPVCLYFSVVSGCLCPAKCCTTRKSLFLVSKLANTLCLIVVAVSFFLYCF